MQIDIVPNRNARSVILLPELIRDGVRIVQRTVANYSALSLQQAQAIRAVLEDEPLAPIRDLSHSKLR